jgi:hypothetical protein
MTRGGLVVVVFMATPVPEASRGARRLLLGDGTRKEAAGVEQYVLVRGD